MPLSFFCLTNLFCLLMKCLAPAPVRGNENFFFSVDKLKTLLRVLRSRTGSVFCAAQLGEHGRKGSTLCANFSMMVIQVPTSQCLRATQGNLADTQGAGFRPHSQSIPLPKSPIARLRATSDCFQRAVLKHIFITGIRLK